MDELLHVVRAATEVLTKEPSRRHDLLDLHLRDATSRGAQLVAYAEDEQGHEEAHTQHQPDPPSPGPEVQPARSTPDVERPFAATEDRHQHQGTSALEGDRSRKYVFDSLIE
jgi:hypothetical protein